MQHIRRWPVPDTRLPFVNQDVTPIQFRGSPGLVSSVWGGAKGGRIVVWNPDTHEVSEFVLPDQIPGAYMLKTATDGGLYLGGGTGELLRFDPATEKFQTLVTGEMSSITWGGCVTDQYAIWSASRGDICVYDWQNDKLVKAFRQPDSQTPPANYGHAAFAAPDGRVIVGMNYPQTHLIVIDLNTMQTESHCPEALCGHPAVYGGFFWDDQTIFVATGGADPRGMLLRYPDFQLVADIEPYAHTHAMGHHGCCLNGELYMCPSPAGDLLKLDSKQLKWERICPAFDGGEGDHISSLAVHDSRLICGVTCSGIAVSYDPTTGQRSSFDLTVMGQCETRALCPVPEIGKVFGAPFITGRFWSLDIETGEGIDHGRGMRGGGQIDFSVWDEAKNLIYMSSYHETNISLLDPRKPIGWPDNPSFFCTASDHEQMRDHGLAFDGQHLWMPTGAQYGALGGALCRIDVATGAIEVRRHIARDQTVNSVVLGHGSVYCGTGIYADGKSTPPTQKRAKLLRVDPVTMDVTAQTSIDDAAKLFAIAIFGDWLLAQGAKQLYLWNADSGEVRQLGSLASAVPGCVIPDKQSGVYWTSSDGTVGRLTITDKSSSYEPVLDYRARYLQQDRSGNIWFATSDEVISFSPDDV